MKVSPRLDGRWRVTGVGMACPLTFLHDIKVVKNGCGHNEMGEKTWGFFVVLDAGENLMLDYSDPLNKLHVQQVLDVLRPVGEEWAGKLYFLKGQVFRFKLERISE